MTAPATPEPNVGLALEVLVDTKEPVIYMLNKPEIYVGSLDTNDIVINQKEISRKHIKVFFVDNTCYISDQGSTNGTYMNDTKVVPGKRVEFLPFMSIRLGSKVLLTLISKERPDVAPDMTERETFIENSRIKRGQDDKTRIISLKELHATKTEKIIKKRKDTAAKKLKETKRMREEKAALRHIGSIALMWIVVGIILNFVWLSLPDKARRIFGVREKREVYTHIIDEVDDKGFRIPFSKLVTKASLNTFLGAKKCSDQSVAVYCSSLLELRLGKNGVIKTKSSQVLMFIEQKEFLDPVRDLASTNVPDGVDISNDNLEKLALIKFVGEELSHIVKSDSPETQYYLVLFARSEERSRIQSVLAIRHNALGSFMKMFEIKTFNDHLKDANTFVRDMDEFYQFY